MKTNLYLLRFLFLAIFLFGSLQIFSQGVGNHMTMSLQNCSQISPDTIQFDLFLKSDGDPVSDLRLNSCAFGINFDPSILSAPNDTFKFILVPGSSEVTVSPLNGFVTTLHPSGIHPYQIRISQLAYTGGNIWGKGIVNTNGTSVTRISGDTFVCPSCTRASANNVWSGATIALNGIQYTIDSVFDDSHLTLTTSAGVQSGLSYSVSSPYFINPMIVGRDYKVGTFKFVSMDSVTHSVQPFVSGTSPNFQLQDATAGGSTKCVAIVYIGQTGTSVAFSNAGMGDGQRSLSTTCSLVLNCPTCPPLASFNSNNTVFCNGSGCVDFYDHSSQGVTSWMWMFPGAIPDTSSAQNPTNICYSSPGTYPVTLVACNGNGCDTLARTPYIVVSNGPAMPTITVAGADSLFSSSATTYQWYLNGVPISGATNSLYVAVQTGTYSVLAGDGLGCTMMSAGTTISAPCTITISVTVTNATCGSCHDGSASAVINNGTPPYTITWYTAPIQNGTSASGLSAGTYTVCVHDVNNCTACTSAIVGVGYCHSSYNLYADTVPHSYLITSTSIGVPPFSYLWSWGDGSTDTTALPAHTYATPGFYTICLSITDSAGCTSAYCDSFTLLMRDNSMINVTVVLSATGLSELQVGDKSFSVYPNPTNGIVTISYSLKQSSQVKIELFNSYGQLVKALANGGQAAGRQELHFDSGKLPAGIYFIRLNTDGNSEMIKMLKMD